MVALVQPVNKVMRSKCSAVQSQKAVSAYFTTKQILPLGFAEQNTKIKETEIILAFHNSNWNLMEKGNCQR